MLLELRAPARAGNTCSALCAALSRRMMFSGLYSSRWYLPAVITTVSLTDREIQSCWVKFSASRWNNLSDMPITACLQRPREIRLRTRWLAHRVELLGQIC